MPVFKLEFNCTKTLLFISVLIFFQNVSIISSAPSETEGGRHIGGPLRRHEILSQNLYEVSWEIDFEKEEIEFHVEAKTRGYVGFGISYTGGMANSDIVIGGVSPNGSTYFNDYLGVGKEMPVLDASQDWKLILVDENDTHTSMHFKRNVSSCDKEDIAITDDTLKIIWAFGDSDDISYHNIHNRGSLSVNFKDLPSDAPDLSMYKKWLVAQPVEIPENDTTYWCTFYKGPQLNKKHHVVGFDIYLNGTTSKKHTHHADLYKCTAPDGKNPDEFFGKYLGYGYDCYSAKEYFPVEHCQLFEFQWSIGGKVTMFPENVGVPVGEGTVEYYMTEIHYDNPNKISGLQIYSGMEVYYTDKLRPIDAGFFQIGVASSKLYSLTIPPNSKDFIVSSHCTSECMENLPSAGVSIFLYLLHSHLSGRKEKLRHFRNDQELPFVANDEYYDFNYQNNRKLRNEVKLLPGDRLTLECTYDTTWKKGKATLGGRSARDEMCQTFVMYYPRVEKVNQCGSYLAQQKMLNLLGLEKVEAAKGEIDPTIVLPKKYVGMKYSKYIENEITWSTEKRKHFQEATRFGLQEAYCAPIKNDSFVQVKYPAIKNEYRVLDSCNLDHTRNYVWLWISISCTAIIIVASVVIVLIVRKCKMAKLTPTKVYA